MILQEGNLGVAKDRRSLNYLLCSSVIKHRARGKHECSVMAVYSASGAMSFYWHCPSEEVFLFYDHDVHLYDSSSLMLRSSCSLKFLSGSFISGNKC